MNKTAKALAFAAVATTLTNCASVPNTGLSGKIGGAVDSIGELAGIKADKTTVISPKTGIAYDTETTKPKPIENTAAQCAASSASRQALKPLLTRIQSAELAQARAVGIIAKTKAKAFTVKAKAEYHFPLKTFKSATQACTQGIAAKLASEGKWDCSSKFGNVGTSAGATPSSASACAKGANELESNFLTRHKQVKEGQYDTGGSKYKNPNF